MNLLMRIQLFGVRTSLNEVKNYFPLCFFKYLTYFKILPNKGSVFMNKIRTLHHLKIFFIMIPILESLKILYRGADKSLARPTSHIFCLTVRIFCLMLVLLYI
jgi:hypothetical protein